ncbi:DNA/RNA polymerases superfamily protein [Gossypium australe]|uniref:DNA/RNA polymerases superfamily protein n=1 Tax=Gossypium australe TaxID=47621 RepID=A0A5B6X3Y5_9ROSI|nr:DNA/RNA polymerases superfamily protein [Gossypium australe]
MYWWPDMKREIYEFVANCLICQQVKEEHQVSSGLPQAVTISKWKWVRVMTDFIFGLPVTPKEKDSIWVIMDRLTNLTHFIPVRIEFSLERLAELYVSEIIRLHGVPTSIISYRDPRFTLRFWGKLHETLGTKLNFSTMFHMQMDGQLERVIQILEDMMKCCILEFEVNWEKYLSLVKLAYNNIYQSSIKMTPFEALYGRKCKTLLYWSELKKVSIIRDCLKFAFDRYKLYIDLKRKGIEFVVGDRVFLKVSLWKKVLGFGRKEKLSPRLIGPYEIVERIDLVAYRLAFPSTLMKIHNLFHYRSDPSHVIPYSEIELQPDLTYFEEPVKILAREIKKLRNK